MENRLDTLCSIKWALIKLGYEVIEIKVELKKGIINIITDKCVLIEDREYIRKRTPLKTYINFTIQEDKIELGISMEEMNKRATEAMKSIFRNGKEE